MDVRSQTLLLDARERWLNQPPEPDENYIATALKKAKDADVVSFDIFDTVLTRVLECPIDLFAYVERELLAHGFDAKGFAKIRFERKPKKLHSMKFISKCKRRRNWQELPVLLRPRAKPKFKLKK